MNVRALMIKLTQNDCTMSDLAKILGISKSSVYRKMSGITEFTRLEIATIKSAFNLNDDDLVEIFFDCKSI